VGAYPRAQVDAQERPLPLLRLKGFLFAVEKKMNSPGLAKPIAKTSLGNGKERDAQSKRAGSDRASRNTDTPPGGFGRLLFGEQVLRGNCSCIALVPTSMLAGVFGIHADRLRHPASRDTRTSCAASMALNPGGPKSTPNARQIKRVPPPEKPG